MKTTLGEIAKVQTGPFGSQLHASDYTDDGVPVVMPMNIGENRVIESGIMRTSAEDAERLSRHKLQFGDIVYSRRGDIERRALIRETEEGWLCGTGCLLVRPNQTVVDPEWLSFWLGTQSSREFLTQHAVGATMLNLNTGILASIPVDAPPLAEQRRIAEILGALDDKIELNRRMNATLEEMARALFRSWFVDFDPVKVKARGGDPTAELGLAPEIAALFPDSFKDSPLGPIPTGWSLTTIGEQCQVVGGGTPSTGEPVYWDGPYAWATPRDMSRLSAPVLLGTERQITEAGLAKISSGLLPVGTVLLSSRAPIGYLAIAKTPVAINQGFIAIKESPDIKAPFIINWCEANMDAIKDRSNGSTFMEISKSSFRPIPLVLGGGKVLKAFNDAVGPLYDRICQNVKESDLLAETRDYLLPRLLNGSVTSATEEVCLA